MEPRYAVYKYDITKGNAVRVPVGAKPLSVIGQNDSIVMYALVNTREKKTELKYYMILGTGWEVENNPDDNYKFLGTAVIKNTWVYHVWVEE
jgi:hypothetical protein